MSKELIEAPRPHCFSCRKDHEIILLNHTGANPSPVYRCPLCQVYGGPVWVEKESLTIFKVKVK